MGYANKEDASAANKKWREANPDKCREYAQRRWKRERDTNPAKYMFNRVKARATRLGIPFDITVDDIVIPTHCPALDIELTYEGEGDTTPSLDRLDPALGYVKGNVVVLSNRANRIKNDATFVELEKIALWLRSQ